MKYTVLLILALLIFSCEKNNNEFDYSYKIIRVSLYYPEMFQDSVIYYYDSEDRLRKISNCNDDNSCGSIYPRYEDNVIKLNSRHYILGNEDRIDSVIDYSISGVVKYTYKDGHIIHELSTHNNEVVAEHYYEYNNGILIKDSTIHDGQYITVYNHISSDILTPDYMIYSVGLREYPLKSKYLIKESIAPEANIKTIHEYTSANNELSDYIRTIDINYADTVDVELTKYYFMEK